jgi:hypothetical protein
MHNQQRVQKQKQNASLPAAGIHFLMQVSELVAFPVFALNVF